MRKITLAVLLLFGAITFCAAQARELSFREFGMATQEMQDVGLCAAHSSLPIGSKARIISDSNGKTIEVTIIRRLSPSSTRIIDLSSAAAAAIGLASGGPVIIETHDLSKPLIPNQSLSRAGTISPGPYDNGIIRLFLHESTGRFSLYSIADKETPLPFFMALDPRTSYLGVLVNNRAYRLGESPAFRTRLGGTPENPAIVFESSFLTVIQQFTFIKTAASSTINGVRIQFTITNKTAEPIEAGLRFLIDTTLGEDERAHFATDQRLITSETIIDTLAADKYWVSRSSRLALVGILDGQNVTRPDFVHFANWKQMYDAAWKTPHVPGKNFNLLPYSIGDSAVCYFYEPVAMLSGATRTVSMVLASEDDGGVVRVVPPPRIGPETASPNIQELEKVFEDKAVQDNNLDNKMAQLIQEDLAYLQFLMTLLDEYAVTGMVSDEELEAIETQILRLKVKYGVP